MLPARFLDIAASAALRVFGGDAVAAAEFLAGDGLKRKRGELSPAEFRSFLQRYYGLEYGSEDIPSDLLADAVDVLALTDDPDDMTVEQAKEAAKYELAKMGDLDRLANLDFRKDMIAQSKRTDFERFVEELISDAKREGTFHVPPLTVETVFERSKSVLSSPIFSKKIEGIAMSKKVLAAIGVVFKLSYFKGRLVEKAMVYSARVKELGIEETGEREQVRQKGGERPLSPSSDDEVDSADDYETRKEKALALAMQRNGGMFALRVKDPGTGKTWVYKAPDGQPDSISDNYYTEDDDDDDDGSGDSSSSPSSPSSESDGESSDNSADGSGSDRLPKLEKVTVKEEPEDMQQEPVNTDPTLVVSSWVDTADRAVTPDIPVTKNRRKRDKEGKRDKKNKKNKKSKKGSRRDREKPDATPKDWKLGSREAIYPYLKMLGFYSTLPQYGFDATTRNFADVGALSAMGIKGFSKTSLAKNTLGAASSTFRGAQKAFALLKPFELASIPLPPVPERIRLFNTFFHPTEMGNVAYYKRAIARVADGEEAYQAAAQSDDYLEYSRPEQISVNELNFARNIVETNFTVRPVERSSGGDQRAAAALVLARGDVDEAFRLMTLNEM